VGMRVFFEDCVGSDVIWLHECEVYREPQLKKKGSNLFFGSMDAVMMIDWCL
jgi:hypothetical protein